MEFTAYNKLMITFGTKGNVFTVLLTACRWAPQQSQMIQSDGSSGVAAAVAAAATQSSLSVCQLQNKDIIQGRCVHL